MSSKKHYLPYPNCVTSCGLDKRESYWWRVQATDKIDEVTCKRCLQIMERDNRDELVGFIPKNAIDDLIKETKESLEIAKKKDFSFIRSNIKRWGIAKTISYIVEGHVKILEKLISDAKQINGAGELSAGNTRQFKKLKKGDNLLPVAKSEVIKQIFKEKRNCGSCKYAMNYRPNGYHGARKCKLGHRTRSPHFYYWICKFWKEGDNSGKQVQEVRLKGKRIPEKVSENPPAQKTKGVEKEQ